MTLPDPNRGQPPLPQPMGPMPAPPSQWQGAEESMRNWLAAKAEEDKRKQEEEKTRQEGLRLEQRKIEQSMLRDSMQGGVPPQLLPMMFAGMGGANLANLSVEWLQQYMAQLQTAQQQQLQQQPHVSPELRRETRMINPNQPNVYGAPTQPSHPRLPSTQLLTGQPIPSQSQNAPSPSTYQLAGMSPSSRLRATQGPVQSAAPTSAPRPPPHAALPRLTTNEMHIHQPPAAPSGTHPILQSQSSQFAQQQEPAAASPSIYFHHWVPPSSQTGGNTSTHPQTPSTKAQEPASAHPLKYESEYSNSPKKRKTQGGHQPAPPPSTGSQYISPSFSHVSSSSSTPGRRGHGRNRSDASPRGYDVLGRPSSRRTESQQRQSDLHNGQEAAQQQQQREEGRSQQSHLSAGPEQSAMPRSPNPESVGSRPS
ncbi:hypothetical protein B0A49_06884 [Cryomyces minteri]|uniref:Uncharacterized protein n=2 Tax=Cryomyces minteri TaxID=331657 RepID=A0A4U0WQV3_9PEZI|nr:hypothetical protein B0A49_06884 [Cryomyces minteri]